MNTDIFARTKIDPSALVQKLDLDTRSVASVRRGERERGGPYGLHASSAWLALSCSNAQARANFS